MKKKSLVSYISKTLSVFGIIVFSSSGLNAWMISVLNPSATDSSNNVLGREEFAAFENYMTDTGAVLVAGSLSSHAIEDSDAVIVNLHSGGGSTYTVNELAVLGTLLNGNVRVLVFGELSSYWDASNKQLADLVGGTNHYSNQGFSCQDDQTVNPDIYPLITEGVHSIYFGTPGKISPKEGNGLSLSSDDGITLWGLNNNFLLFMDVDLMSGSIDGGIDNDQLTRNIANWLSGVDIAPTPEPSTYAMVLGVSLVGTVLLRRRRCQVLN